jgi:hypothetical protein
METQAKVLGRRTSILLYLLMIFTSSRAEASPIIQYWENRTQSHEGLFLDPRVSYYTTSQDLNASGQSVSLPKGVSVSQMYFDLNAAYGINENFFVFGRLSGLSSKLNNSLQVNNSVFGLSDQLVGTSYRVYRNPNGLSIDLQAEVTVPAYNNSNQKQNVSPYLGDGSTDFTGGGFIEIPLPMKYFSVEAGAAFTKRSYGYSSAIPWSVMIKHDPLYGFLFSAGLRGQVSLQTDATTPANAISDQTIGGGGSYLIDAVNPAWNVAQVTLGYKLRTGHALYATTADTLFGSDIPSGFQVSAGVKFDFGTKNEDSDDEETPQTKSASASPSRPKIVRDHGFTNYDLDAQVVSVNDQLYLIKINKGRADGVKKGQLFDIFQVVENAIATENTQILIARAKVTYLKNDEAALAIVEYYKEKWIEEGFAAKRVLQ